MEVDAPTDTTLRIDRPPVCVAVTLEGPAEMALPPGCETVLHTEQGGYAADPRPPSFVGDRISFVRPGAAILQAG